VKLNPAIIVDMPRDAHERTRYWKSPTKRSAQVTDW